jgi:hypothetical protein
MNILARLIGSLTALVLVVSMVFFFTMIGAIINGFVLSQLWAWFIVPYFGFVPLSIPVAYGFSLIMAFLTYHVVGLKAEDNKDEKVKQLGVALIRPFMYLLIGWLAHAYFMPTDMKPMFNFNSIPVAAQVAPQVAPHVAPVAK